MRYLNPLTDARLDDAGVRRGSARSACTAAYIPYTAAYTAYVAYTADIDSPD